MRAGQHPFGIRGWLQTIGAILAVWIGAVLVPSRVLAQAPKDAAPLSFVVSFDRAVRAAPATGRLLVYLIRSGADVPAHSLPSDAPFYDDPQPLYGMDVKDVAPGAEMIVDARADGFPAKLSELTPGTYRAQAVLEVARGNSRWRRIPGNLYSGTELIHVSAPGLGGPVKIALTNVVEPFTPTQREGVEWVEVKSALLSQFRGEPVILRVGALIPEDLDPKRRYPSIYEVPGFSGDHNSILQRAARRNRGRITPAASEISRSTFMFIVDPESPNGHMLWANSANNGPAGDALVREVIPALEKKYPLVADPSARIVQGHSSGGWSALWLILQYPDVFGACWAGSPDPVDFRRFQKIDLYSQPNFYTDAQGKDLPSNTVNGVTRMTIRQENMWEEVKGPRNTSGGQWDSWQAVFGPRDADGRPAALYDPSTGAIDKAIAERYRAFDIGALVRSDPKKLGPLFTDRIRLLVGEDDEWNLDEAVALLLADLTAAGYRPSGDAGKGGIAIVPGRDHGTVMTTPEASAVPEQILTFFRKGGHVR